MTAIATENKTEKNLTEKRDKRAKSIAAMGWSIAMAIVFTFRRRAFAVVKRLTTYGATKSGKIRCNCLEFEEAAVTDSGFRCEHILAVKYALVAKNTEPVTKQPV
jgi:predicted nucleic acid-binding Zn finger protein